MQHTNLEISELVVPDPAACHAHVTLKSVITSSTCAVAKSQNARIYPVEQYLEAASKKLIQLATKL